MLLTTDYN